MPLLSNDEFANTAGFLEGFVNGDVTFDFNAFDPLQTHSLPTFQGMSTTFGRPEPNAYDTSIFTTTDPASARPFDTTTFLSNRGSELSRSSMAAPADLHHRLFPNGLETTPPETTRRAPMRSRQPDHTILGFGSDAAFANRCYTAPPGQDETLVTNKLMAVVQNIAGPSGEPESHPNSPTIGRKRNSKDMDDEVPAHLSHTRKRRQSELEEAQSGNSSEEETDPSGNQRKGSKTDRPSWNDYRRKSRGKLNEPKRHNLTEKEKRQNHIRSEQKRRNQIKEGFASLLAMMPEAYAEGSGNSKCIILAKSVKWLTGLNDGNLRLRSQLAQLGGSL